MRGIAPDEVRGIAVRDDDAQITAVHVGRNQSRQMTPFGLGPAMQHDKAFSVGSNEQVVGVVLGVRVVLHHCARVCEQLVRNDESLRARFQIHVRDAGGLRSHLIKNFVPDARIAVARTAIRHARKVAGDRFFAVRTQCIDRGRQRVFLAGLHVHDVAHELVLLAVVPDDLRLGARDPLQHAALLPVPRL